MWISRKKWDEMQYEINKLNKKFEDLEKHTFYYEINDPFMGWSSPWKVGSVKDILELMLNKLGYRVDILDRNQSRISIKKIDVKEG